MRRSRSPAPLLFGVILLGGLAAGCASARPRAVPREVPATDQWFLSQRLSLGKVIPVERRRQEADRILRADANAPGTWISVGPTNIGGRISSLAIGRDLAGNEIFWMGSAAGGVFSSADGGATWQPRFDGETALSIGAVTVHPVDQRIVFVGTGEEDLTTASYDGEGVFKSTNAGASWSYIGLAETRRIAKIEIDRVDPQRMFVAAGGALYYQDSNRGLYRTLDGGGTWSRVLYGDIDAGVIDVAIDPSNPQRVFAAIWQHSRANNTTYWGGTKTGLYRSTDGGNTWTKLAGGFPTGSIGRIGVAVAPSSPNIVYASVRQTSGSFQGVYRSLNGGDTWSRVDTGLSFFLASFGWWFGPIYVAPDDPQTVYLLDLDIHRSVNGGRNWTTISGGLHVDQHALIVESKAGRILAGNDGGFYRSQNGGTSWTRFTSLPISQFYDICTDQQQPWRRFGGLQDNNTVRTTTGASDDWHPVLGGDGMECEVNPQDSNKVYAEAQNGDIHRSVDGGASFSSAKSGIDPGETFNWVTPIRVDWNESNVVYTGAQKVYRSTNDAQSWTAISPVLTGSTLPPGNPVRGTISAIGVSRVDGQVIWAGTDNGNLWVTENGGTSWTQVNPDTATNWFTEVSADLFERNTGYATISGYKLGSRVPYVRKTTDLGATWIDITGNLPQVPMNSVIPDPLHRDRLFAASDIGVHVTHDGGASWELLGSGMPLVVVHDIQVNETTWTLFAGTHSRSMFAYDLRQLPQQDWDSDGAGNIDDCAREDATTGPGVPESNDGRDNQCAGDADFGIVDEISGTARFFGAGNGTEFSWPAQSGATAYRVARAGEPRFLSGCTLFDVTTPAVSDAASPVPGAGFFYLVRAQAPNLGSWGRNSDGTERTGLCP